VAYCHSSAKKFLVLMSLLRASFARFAGNISLHVGIHLEGVRLGLGSACCESCGFMAAVMRGE
jgi:hypothetical protein